MAHAILMLTDEGEAFALHAEYSEKFNPASPAHQHAALLVKHLDTLAGRISEPVETPVTKAARKIIVPPGMH
jgi:hypothetical protein